jgi:hypothetical protein
MRARLRLVPLVLLLFAFTGASVGVGSAAASHNRASQLNWHTTSTPREAEFELTFVARASYYGALEPGDTSCDQLR